MDPSSAPFEGPEKLLEIWFAPSPTALPKSAATPQDGKVGLRKISRQSWDQILAIVKCKILSCVEGVEMDAYLLSESSLFVSPHRIILKTCGTTLNLLGLPRILEVASIEASLPLVHRLFYSRKSFMFPDRQHGPHRDWRDEVQFLDNIFANGSAYTVGKMNGDHWLLYMTNPQLDRDSSPLSSSATLISHTPSASRDYTIEILMSHLSESARQPFFRTSPLESDRHDPSSHANSLSAAIGITEIFPSQITNFDAYSFQPCGYSSNALLTWNHPTDNPPSCGEGYFTIHVTPEQDWSYASFECNVPLPCSPSTQTGSIPDLEALVRRVVKIFEPGRLSLTLFISSADNTPVDEVGDSEVEKAQRAFKRALTGPRPVQGADSRSLIYSRSDKINYEFGGYDLAFATFDLRSQ